MIFDEPEGATPLDPDEIDGLKFAHVATRGELNELEQANITAGMLWLRRRRKNPILTESFMRQLHKKLFGEVWRWAGAFRKTEKNIGVDPIEIAVQLRMLLGDALYWAEHGTYAPLEAAAKFHHRLVQIHLFPNGNGRHARIATDLFLKEYFQHPPIDWAGGYELENMNERRKDYIAALRGADKGEYSALRLFVGLHDKRG